MAKKTLLLFFLLLSAFFSQIAYSLKKPPPATARKEDIPYIKCSVCQHLVKQLFLHVKKKRDQVPPKQVSEYEIIEVAENICNLVKPEADWILRLDIVEDGDILKLVEQMDEGECRTECKTIERTCQEVVGYHDTDIAEFLYKGEPEPDTLTNLLCKDLSKACVGKTPPVPKGREPGEAFVAKSSKDAEMERIMRSMSDMPGAPNMKMYSRDDLMNRMPDFDDEDEDDDDIEDEEEQHKGSKVGAKSGIDKLLNQAHSFTNTVKKGTQQAIITTQKHIKMTYDWLGNWWSGKSVSGKKNSNSQPSEFKTAEL